MGQELTGYSHLSEVGGVGLATVGNTMAAVDSSSRLFGVAIRPGVNVGRVGTVDREGIEPKLLEPGLVNGISRTTVPPNLSPIKDLNMDCVLVGSRACWTGLVILQRC